MSPETLQSARAELESTVNSADGEVRESLERTETAFADFAAGDGDPDATVVDEQLNDLRQIRKRVDDERLSQLDRIIEHAEQYRTGLE